MRFKLTLQSLSHGRHSCSLEGVAWEERGAYVYMERERGPVFGKTCRLAIKASGSSIELSDGGSCVEHCGAGRSFEGVRFPR